MRELAAALAISLALAVIVPAAIASRGGSALQRTDFEDEVARAAVDLHSVPVEQLGQTLATPETMRCCAQADGLAPPDPGTASIRPAPMPTAQPPLAAEAATVEPTQPSLGSPASAPARTPNEGGELLVLEYHLIERPGGRWSRTPEELRADVDRLIEEGYYPLNLIDLAKGYIDVPAGKSPVVLTFDDSSSGQCRYLSDGSFDPDSACGILTAAAEAHPEEWRTRATFFVLIDVDVPERELFGQPELAQRKLRELVSLGMEIGSHTVSHIRLDRASAETVRAQLAGAETTLERLIPGYEVDSLSLPLGGYPADEQLLISGEWQGESYDLTAAVEVAGGPSPSPHSQAFDRLHIRRVQIFGDALEVWLGYFATHPERRYVSDGDPSVVSLP